MSISPAIEGSRLKHRINKIDFVSKRLRQVINLEPGRRNEYEWTNISSSAAPVGAELLQSFTQTQRKSAFVFARVFAARCGDRDDITAETGRSGNEGCGGVSTNLRKGPIETAFGCV